MNLQSHSQNITAGIEAQVCLTLKVFLTHNAVFTICLSSCGIISVFLWDFKDKKIILDFRILK